MLLGIVRCSMTAMMWQYNHLKHIYSFNATSNPSVLLISTENTSGLFKRAIWAINLFCPSNHWLFKIFFKRLSLQSVILIQLCLPCAAPLTQQIIIFSHYYTILICNWHTRIINLYSDNITPPKPHSVEPLSSLSGQ